MQIKYLHVTLSAAVAGAGIAAALSIAPIADAESRGASAIVTIGQLKAQGFDVRIDRIGGAPLDRCVVTDIRNPRQRTEFVPVIGRGGRDRIIEVPVAQTVSVSLDCSAT